MKKIQMLSQVVARELADRLQYAIQSSRRLYGKDVEVGYEVLEMLIAYEGNHTGENLVSSDDKFFVSVSSTICCLILERRLFASAKKWLMLCVLIPTNFLFRILCTLRVLCLHPL